MQGFIPTGDAERIAWLNNFTSWVVTHGATHGLNVADINALTTVTNAAITTYTAHKAAQAAAIAATADKNNAMDAAIDLAREDAKRIQSYPATTDGDRGAAGITIPDTTPTATSPMDIKEILPPLLLLDFSIRQQVLVHWGVNPTNEHQNAKPHGVIGCEIQYSKDNESSWTILEQATLSPISHNVEDTTPTTYIYRARYVDKKLNHGGFGDPAKCTISV